MGEQPYAQGALLPFIRHKNAPFQKMQVHYTMKGGVKSIENPMILQKVVVKLDMKWYDTQVGWDFMRISRAEGLA